MINHTMIVDAGALLTDIRVMRMYVNDLTYNLNLEMRLEGSSQEAGQHMTTVVREAFETLITAVLVHSVNEKVQELHDMGVDAQELRLTVPEGRLGALQSVGQAMGFAAW